MEIVLDAASASAMVGLSQHGSLLWRSSLLEPREHTRQLLPALLEGLQVTNTRFEDLELVISALGPGPFSGLRVITAVAKGLAVGARACLTGLSTLEAEAGRCEQRSSPVRPVVGAGRSGYLTALYSWNGTAWSQASDIVRVDASELARVAHDGGIVFEEVSFQAGGGSGLDRREWATASVVRSRIESLALLGWNRYLAGDTIAAASLQPIYLHPPQITVPRERRP